MNYDKLFKKLLLEGTDLPQDGSNRYPSGQEDFNQSLDDGTDPDEFLTQGLKASVEAVQADFNKRMTAFANALNPQAVKTMTIGRLKAEISKVFKYVNGIQVYAKSKIDALAQNPAAILAAFIASDPSKQAAFEGLHGDLEEFNKSLEETEGKLAQLKGKIDEFIQDISEGTSSSEHSSAPNPSSGGLQGQTSIH